MWEENQIVWVIFHILNSQRQVDMQASSIAVTEIFKMLDEYGIEDYQTRVEYLEMIVRMDRLILSRRATK